MKISINGLKAIGQDLNKRQPPKLADHIDQDMTLKQIIAALAPNLLRMKRRGITTDGMVAALKENKVSIDGKTLNRYLSEFLPPKPPRKKKVVPDAATNQETTNSSDESDGFTPKEEPPSEQNGPQVTEKPDPLKELI